MLSRSLHRLGQTVLVMAAMTVIVFVGLHLIGDPIEILISPEANQAERAKAIADLGLDQPLWRQYLVFLVNLAHGDVGRSFVHNEPALTLILSRLPATLELALSAVLLSIAIGIPLGVVAGLDPDGPISRLLLAVSILGFSVPTFWLGMVMIMLLSVTLGWLPSTGRGATVTMLGLEWSFLTLDGLRHLLMPALTLAVFNISLVLRLVRSGVQDAMLAEFVKYARAKGLGRPRIVLVHVLKTVMIPTVTVIGLEIGSTIAFSVVTETVFAWPGMGRLIIDSINLLDRPVIVAYLLVIVLLFVTINLVVDLAYTWLDPRVRLGD